MGFVYNCWSNWQFKPHTTLFTSQEGQTWPSPDDPCKNITCGRDFNGRLTHVERVATCSQDCKKGWTYQKPPAGECCGHCQQTACVLDDKLVEPGKPLT